MSVWLLLEPQDEGMVYPDQLYHHGTKGMHWGIRRFQPYGPGQKVKGGKEVGIATKVKQRVTGTVEGIKQHHAAKKEAKAVKKAEAERKAQVEHQLSKQQAIEKGTIEDLAKFKGELTNEEYGRAFARLQNEQRLEAMVAANQKTAWDTMDKGMEIVNKLAGYAGTVANAKNKIDAMSDALNRKKDKQKAEDELREKNKFLTNIHNITELNEGMDKHKITPQEYNAALNLLANKKLKNAQFGSDFEDQNERAAREQAERDKADYTKWAGEQAWKQYNREQAKNAWNAQKEAQRQAKREANAPKDGEWWKDEPSSKSSSSSSRYGESGAKRTNQLLLTMKDVTPSSYNPGPAQLTTSKKILKGAKSGSSGTVKSTGTMNFGDKTMLYKKSKGSDRKGYVQATRNAVDATQQERARQKEVDKKRKSALRHSALDLTPTELAHHGIKGQKWGVRRFQKKDGSRTKAGKDRAKFLRDRVKASRGGMVDDTWKTGSAALIAKTDNDIEQLTIRYRRDGSSNYASPSIVMRDFLRDTGDVPPDYRPAKGFTSFEEADLSYVNPDWGQPGTTQNCAKCAVATELMRYGVAVKAGRQAFPSSADAMSYWFDGAEKVEKSMDDTEKLLASYGDGASGTIAGYYPNGAGGHAMHFSVNNGQVHVQDGQNGRHFNSIREAAETYGFDTNREMHSYRLDTATPNWEHMAEDSVIGAPRWQSKDDRWRAKQGAPFRFTNNSDGTIGNYDLTQESSNEIFRRHYIR